MRFVNIVGQASRHTARPSGPSTIRRSNIFVGFDVSFIQQATTLDINHGRHPGGRDNLSKSLNRVHTIRPSCHRRLYGSGPSLGSDKESTEGINAPPTHPV